MWMSLSGSGFRHGRFRPLGEVGRLEESEGVLWFTKVLGSE